MIDVGDDEEAARRPVAGRMGDDSRAKSVNGQAAQSRRRSDRAAITSPIGDPSSDVT